MILPKQRLRTAYPTFMSAWTVYTRSHLDIQRIPSTGVICEARAFSLCAYRETTPHFCLFLELHDYASVSHAYSIPLYTLLFDLFSTRSSLTIPSYTSFLLTTTRITFTPRSYSSSSCPTAPLLSLRYQ